MGKPSLTLAMIVRDVAPFITSCLDSVVQVCDEVIITDTGSEDDTKAVVREFLSRKGVKHQILDFTRETHPHAFLLDDPSLEQTYGAPHPFSGNIILADFAAARQFGWNKATSDFVIWIDSDDVVSGAEKIPALLERMEREHLDHVMVEYEYAHAPNGTPSCILTRERIVRRNSMAGTKWSQPIHEVLCPLGPGSFVNDFKIVHRRKDVAPKPKIPNRNLKVLLRHYHREKENHGPDAIDPRTLFYLGMEWRFLNEEKSLPFLREYIKRSGWDEERALAHLWIGQMFEKKGDHESAFLEYSACAVEFPWHPDGFFGCARSFYFRSDWQKCIEFTERAQKILADEQERKSVLQHNPLDRNYFPLQFLSKALIEVGRVKDAVEVCKKGLAINPSDEIFAKNLKVCQEWLADQEKPKPARVGFSLNEPLDEEPKDLPKHIIITFAIQLWKLLRRDGQFDRALAFLSTLPDEIAGADRVREALEMTKKLAGNPPAPEYKTPEPKNEEPPKVVLEPISQTKLDIVIWTGPAWEKWSPYSISKGGIGGSETAACYMAWELKRLGHRVRVYSDIERNVTCEGVDFIQYEEARTNPALLDCDVFVSSRQPYMLELPFRSKLRLLWVHDIHVGGRSDQLDAQLARADRILCLSKWHKEFFLKMYPSLSPEKIFVTRNGIDTTRYLEEPHKEGNRLIYSSSANRGLTTALDILPRIRAEVPDAELHVYYGFETWRAFAEKHARNELPEIDAIEKRVKETPGVVYHGRVGQHELAKAQLASKVWMYPTDFTETSCITAMESQAAGCVPVTTALAALEETVHHGIVIKGKNSQPDYQDLYVSEVVKLLKDDEHREKFARAARKEALRRHPWSRVASEWQAMLCSLLESKAPVSVEEEGERDVHEIKLGEQRSFRLAFTYGYYSSSLHGKFDIPSIYERQGLTGSESSFFNMVKALCEMGHQVDVFCDTAAHYAAHAELAGAHVYPIWTTVGTDYDAYLVWNEPDLLRPVPRTALRICFQQLNDFRNYTKPGWDEFVDLYVFPSDTHRKFICKTENIDEGKTIVIPNSVNLDFYAKERPRDKSIVWCSSPDRGLHVLLDIFPEVRKQVPDAVLKVYYRFERWYETVKELPDENGRRARLIQSQLEKLGRYGENGVIMFDAVSNRKIAEELLRSSAYTYTCEPLQFTEGFSVATMDACAAGCPAIISDADALGEIYKDGACIVPGKPSEQRDVWIAAITSMLKDQNLAAQWAVKGQKLAASHDRRNIAKKLIRILNEKVGSKK